MFFYFRCGPACGCVWWTTSGFSFSGHCRSDPDWEMARNSSRHFRIVYACGALPRMWATRQYVYTCRLALKPFHVHVFLHLFPIPFTYTVSFPGCIAAWKELPSSSAMQSILISALATCSLHSPVTGQSVDGPSQIAGMVHRPVLQAEPDIPRLTCQRKALYKSRYIRQPHLSRMSQWLQSRALSVPGRAKTLNMIRTSFVGGSGRRSINWSLGFVVSGREWHRKLPIG